MDEVKRASQATVAEAKASASNADGERADQGAAAAGELLLPPAPASGVAAAAAPAATAATSSGGSDSAKRARRSPSPGATPEPQAAAGQAPTQPHTEPMAGREQEQGGRTSSAAAPCSDGSSLPLPSPPPDSEEGGGMDDGDGSLDPMETDDQQAVASGRESGGRRGGSRANTIKRPSPQAKTSSGLEAEEAAALPDLPEQQQAGSPGAGQAATLSAAELEALPVLADVARNKDLKRDLPLVCYIHGCGVDLTPQPDYYQRYRICKDHLKAPALLVDGIPQRFCQQCGRFQELKEFDSDKRNCRTRLQQHNSRRRKVFALGQELRRNRFVKGDSQLIDTLDPQTAAAAAAAAIAASLPWQPADGGDGFGSGGNNSVLPLLADFKLPPPAKSAGGNKELDVVLPPALQAALSMPGPMPILPLPPLPSSTAIPEAAPAPKSRTYPDAASEAAAFAAAMTAIGGEGLDTLAGAADPKLPRMSGAKRDFTRMDSGGLGGSGGSGSGGVDRFFSEPARGPHGWRPHPVDRSVDDLLAARSGSGGRPLLGSTSGSGGNKRPLSALLGEPEELLHQQGLPYQQLVNQQQYLAGAGSGGASRASTAVRSLTDPLRSSNLPASGQPRDTTPAARYFAPHIPREGLRSQGPPPPAGQQQQQQQSPPAVRNPFFDSRQQQHSEPPCGQQQQQRDRCTPQPTDRQHSDVQALAAAYSELVSQIQYLSDELKEVKAQLGRVMQPGGASHRMQAPAQQQAPLLPPHIQQHHSGGGLGPVMDTAPGQVPPQPSWQHPHSPRWQAQQQQQQPPQSQASYPPTGWQQPPPQQQQQQHGGGPPGSEHGPPLGQAAYPQSSWGQQQPLPPSHLVPPAWQQHPPQQPGPSPVTMEQQPQPQPAWHSPPAAPPPPQQQQQGPPAPPQPQEPPPPSQQQQQQGAAGGFTAEDLLRAFAAGMQQSQQQPAGSSAGPGSGQKMPPQLQELLAKAANQHLDSSGAAQQPASHQAAAQEHPAPQSHIPAQQQPQLHPAAPLLPHSQQQLHSAPPPAAPRQEQQQQEGTGGGTLPAGAMDVLQALLHRQPTGTTAGGSGNGTADMGHSINGPDEAPFAEQLAAALRAAGIGAGEQQQQEPPAAPAGNSGSQPARENGSAGDRLPSGMHEVLALLASVGGQQQGGSTASAGPNPNP